MKHFFMSLIAVVVLVVLFAIAYWLNLPGVHTFLGAANDALTEIFGALFVGLKLLFFTGLVLGIAYAVIELRKRSRITVISGTKHRPAQAIIHKGELVQLAQPGQAQLDPMQQLAMLKTVMQMQGQMSKLAQQTVVQEIVPAQPLEIEAPKETIPAIVRYVDVQDEVPDNMSLLGIHPADGSLELSDWEKLKMLWIVGSSSTGKSNTVFGKALEARNHGAKLLVIDQHAVKPDSLARKLEPLKDAFLRPIAQTDDQVLSTLEAFKTEFERRVRGASCELKIVLIMDEINRMARNEKLLAAIKEIVAIGGEESRGFGMYVWAISQKAVYLKWLRDSAITVIAHRVTRLEEAMLACNDDRKAAQRLLKFPVGRSFIYGVDFDDLIELQQPLYEVPEASIVDSSVTNVTETSSSQMPSNNQAEKSPEDSPEVALEGTGRTDDIDYSFELKKILREAARLRSQGVATDAILKQLGLKPGGRNNQDLQAVLDMIEQAE